MGADVVARLGAAVARVRVPNTGLMAEPTNCYLVGDLEHGPALIIDPGSAFGAARLRAGLAALGPPKIAGIVLTHAHPDHAGGVEALRARFDAPVWLHPDELPMVAERQLDLRPDRALLDGAVFALGETRLEAVHTPGHARGHVALIEVRDRLTFAGDLVSGAGTVAITPPYGDMRAYLRSLERLRALGVGRLLPGHGEPLDDGPEAITRLIERRLAREAEILALLERGVASVDELVARLYPDLCPRFRVAAAGTVAAHLDKLLAEGRVAPGDLSP